MNPKLMTRLLVLGAAATMAAGSAQAFDWSSPLKSIWPAKTAQADGKPAPAEAAPDAAAPAPAAAAAPKIEPTQAPNYRAIVQQYAPAVVGVTIEGVHKVTAEDGPAGLPDDPFFQFFRGMPGFQLRMPRGNGEVPVHGQGSGFIISADGLILTNAHVVREAREVTVRLQDRREFRARVLGVDPATDVAVLRIDAKGLPTVRLGDPKQLMVGDYVLAIGAPYGLESTATSGIVSAKGRSLPGDGTSYVPFIQTDAAINPGNSGGPLFDAAGGVVGINAQIYSTSGGFQGLAFAVPIDVAMHVKDQIVATGKAQHARLGVALQELNQPLAESFGLSKPDGAVISRVDADSAASAAGLKAGDVILKIDGVAVQRSGDISSRIGMMQPGEKITLQVWRDRATREVTAKLGSAQPEKTADAGDETGEAGGKLGLALRPLTREERSQAGLDRGLVVEEVSGAAQRAGVQPGDIVMSVNGAPVTSVDQVRQSLKDKPKTVALLVQRGDTQLFIPVRLG